MMRVLVTGGNGAVGKACVARLVKNGFSVKVIARTPGIEIPGAGYEVCDINDYPRLRETVRGIEAIVHLAAIPAPSGGASDQVFYANVQGTFNVYKASGGWCRPARSTPWAYFTGVNRPRSITCRSMRTILAWLRMCIRFPSRW